MSIHSLDLEQQERLDQLKAFWKRYAGYIIGGLLLWALAYGGWQWWQYQQKKKAAQVSVLFERFQQSLATQNTKEVQALIQQLQKTDANAFFSKQALIEGAKMKAMQGDTASAIAWLKIAAEKKDDEGLFVMARLRWASLLIEQNKASEALTLLNFEAPEAFKALIQEMKGDAWLQLKKTPSAIQAYRQAFQSMNVEMPQRKILEMKLHALGVETDTIEKKVKP